MAKIVDAQIVSIGFEDDTLYAVTLEYKLRRVATYEATVLANTADHSLKIIHSDEFPEDFKEERIKFDASRLLGVWKLGELRNICPFEVEVK